MNNFTASKCNAILLLRDTNKASHISYPNTLHEEINIKTSLNIVM